MKTALFMIVIALALASGANAQDREVIVKIGENLPDFEVQLLDGGKLTTAQTRGKILLINFWATWSPPCLEEFARLKPEILDRFTGPDFVFLSISREDTPEQVKTFREKTGYIFSVGMDPRREIFSKFATATIPRDFVINKTGKITYMTNGYTPKTFNDMVKHIQTLLNEP
jgi:peroxiredoxin